MTSISVGGFPRHERNSYVVGKTSRGISRLHTQIGSTFSDTPRRMVGHLSSGCGGPYVHCIRPVILWIGEIYALSIYCFLVKQYRRLSHPRRRLCQVLECR